LISTKLKKSVTLALRTRSLTISEPCLPAPSPDWTFLRNLFGPLLCATRCLAGPKKDWNALVAKAAG
jgi:hypothetical protein